jgi:hypothetical protein
VGNKQITVSTVTAGLVKQEWLIWINMNEQRELALSCLVCILWATAKPHILIWVEKEAVPWGLLTKLWFILLLPLRHFCLTIP